MRSENLLDDIEPGVWDIILDAKILGDASLEMKREMNQGNPRDEYLEEELDRKYKDFERLEPIGS